MYLLVLRSEGYVSLEVEESLVGVSLNLQAFSPLKVGLGILLLEVCSNCEILDGLAEIAENGKYQPSEIEVLGDIILTFFDGLIDISHRFIEIIFIEVEHGSEVIEGRYMIIG